MNRRTPKTEIVVELMRRGQRQKDFSRQVGLHPSTFSRIINGWAIPRHQDMLRISSALGKKPEDIFPEFGQYCNALVDMG